MKKMKHEAMPDIFISFVCLKSWIFINEWGKLIIDKWGGVGIGVRVRVKVGLG